MTASQLTFLVSLELYGILLMKQIGSTKLDSNIKSLFFSKTSSVIHNQWTVTTRGVDRISISWLELGHRTMMQSPWLVSDYIWLTYRGLASVRETLVRGCSPSTFRLYSATESRGSMIESIVCFSCYSLSRKNTFYFVRS